MRIPALALTFSLILAAACGRHAEMGIPHPTAYPRPNLPDTLMVVTNEAPLVFYVNAQSEVTYPRPGWLDISYPTLGATVHVTFTMAKPDEIEAIKENRMERLMLNAGDRPVDFSEFTNGAGFDIVTATSEGSATPVQFLATDDSEWVVSGALYLSTPDAAAVDSLKPIIDAIRSDLIKSMTNMRYK